MLKADWRRGILSGSRIRLFSMLAAQDFWELIMMSWSSERFREDRTRKSSNGALHRGEDLAKKKSVSGVRFFPNEAGGTTLAPTWKRTRSDQVWAIGMIFKPGWISMMPKKDEPLDQLESRRIFYSLPGSEVW